MSEREWRFYLDDMIDFAERVLAYTAGLDQPGFVTSGLTYDATARNLELLGEAASHIPAESANPLPRSLAPDHRHPQPVDPCLSRDRQRHPVEHH